MRISSAGARSSKLETRNSPRSRLSNHLRAVSPLSAPLGAFRAFPAQPVGRRADGIIVAGMFPLIASAISRSKEAPCDRSSTLSRAPIGYRRESLLANDNADRLPDRVSAGADGIPRYRHFLPSQTGGTERRRSTNRNRPGPSRHGRRHHYGLTPN